MESHEASEKKLTKKKKRKDHQEHALHLLHQMLRIRRFEEKAAELYTTLKIRGFLHLYIGEEAVAVGVMEALRPEDAVVATYREQPCAGAWVVSRGDHGRNVRQAGRV